ncbi:MAG: LPS-assembly protein LptD, partial [Phycisphaerales bacterium]|nr:LPS-assembly protein LptD [Phycisphaerales bacterium]
MALALLAACVADIAPATAQTNGASNIEAVEPLLPPGISDFDLELYGKFAYLWNSGNEQVVEVLGNFTARMGEYELKSRDAVVWFRSVSTQGKVYLDADIFLWQGAEIIQPGGTVETGPALVVTLRTFGKQLLNIDSYSRQRDDQSDVYSEAVRARRVLEVEPADSMETAEQPVQVSPTVEQLLSQRPKVKKRIAYQADETYSEPYNGASVVLAIGNVYVAQGSPTQSGDYIEIRADAAVLFLHGDAVGSQIPGFVDESRADRPKPKRVDIDEPLEDVAPADEPTLEGRKAPRESVQEFVSAVYLEGDVVLLHGDRMIRAPRLYYDFDNDKALILDAVTRAVEPNRELPIYVRAAEIRQLDSVTYQAKDAQVTTSEFHTPHVALGAKELVFTDITPRDERGDVVGIQAGTYEAKHTTLNLDGKPLAYWPYSTGSFSEDTQAFKRAKSGYNSEFGALVETEWYLFNLLGLQEPEGYNATLRLDYFSRRGPAIGIDVDYQQEDYYGLVRSYYIRDDGQDDLGGIRNNLEPDTDNRGRLLFRHRHFLPKGWELTLENGYLSDDNFLESFERNEFENGKRNETLARLLKRQENWQYSVMANWRIN